MMVRIAMASMTNHVMDEGGACGLTDCWLGFWSRWTVNDPLTKAVQRSVRYHPVTGDYRPYPLQAAFAI